jgi:hypothetical protein
MLYAYGGKIECESVRACVHVVFQHERDERLAINRVFGGESYAMLALSCASLLKVECRRQGRCDGGCAAMCCDARRSDAMCDEL